MCLFADQEGLGQILGKKEVSVCVCLNTTSSAVTSCCLLQGGFVLRKFTTLCSPLACVSEKQLHLSQRSLLGMGRAKYDPQDTQHTICE